MLRKTTMKPTQKPTQKQIATAEAKVELAREAFRTEALSFLKLLFAHDPSRFIGVITNYGQEYADTTLWKGIYEICIRTDYCDVSQIKNSRILSGFKQVYKTLSPEVKVKILAITANIWHDASASKEANVADFLRSESEELQVEALKSLSDQKISTISSALTWGHQRALFIRIIKSINIPKFVERIQSGLYKNMFPSLNAKDCFFEVFHSDLKSGDRERYLRWFNSGLDTIGSLIRDEDHYLIKKAVFRWINDHDGFIRAIEIFTKFKINLDESERLELTKQLIKQDTYQISRLYQASPGLYDEKSLRELLLKKIEEKTRPSPEKIIEGILSGQPQRLNYGMPFEMWHPLFQVRGY